MTDGDRYLHKARESLASAEADAAARRYNSAANRSYYAAFQAAVAALIRQEIRPKKAWEHNFVASQFSGKLVRRRKVIPARFTHTLDNLFDLRVTADYEEGDVSGRSAQEAAKAARDFVAAVAEIAETGRIAEDHAPYGGTEMTPATRTKARELIRDIEERILGKFPEAEFEIIELGASNYRLSVWGDFEDYLDLMPLLNQPPSKTDILIDHGIRIVVLALGRRDSLN